MAMGKVMGIMRSSPKLQHSYARAITATHATSASTTEENTSVRTGVTYAPDHSAHTQMSKKSNANIVTPCADPHPATKHTAHLRGNQKGPTVKTFSSALDVKPSCNILES
jgi:hypothetical protein